LNRRSRRGIALFTTLVLLTVLAMLVASFTSIHQKQLHLMQNDEHHQAAEEAARSALEYCQFRLERHRQWGSAEFDGAPKPDIATLQIEERTGTTRVDGKVLASGAEFRVRITNNISGTADVDGVPGGYCRLRVTASRGRSEVRREALLGTAPIFDGAVVASKNINIDAESLTISSTDPFRNRIRAKGNIEVPDYDGPFRFNPADSATETGLLWSQKGIRMGGKDLENPTHAQNAAEATGGRFLPRAATHHDVYDLQLEEVVNWGPVEADEQKVEVESGVYVFNRLETSHGDIPVLERRDWAIDPVSGEVTGDHVEEVWLVNDGLPTGATDGIAARYGIPENKVNRHDSNEFSLDTGVHVHFNSLNPYYGGTPEPPHIVLNSDVDLVANGDFGIMSASGNYDPVILFRDPITGEVGGKHSGTITALGSGEGKPGSIYLQGAIIGSGKLLAKGDVTIRNTFANVDSDGEDSDLSIYAGKNVTIRPQKQKWFDEETGTVDSSAEGHTAFRGLVFAGEDVLIEADKDVDPNVKDPANVRIEGAVVARDGNVTVQSGKDVNFIYNPLLLDSILARNTASRIRMELAVWREL